MTLQRSPFSKYLTAVFALFAISSVASVFAQEQWIKLSPTGTLPPGMASHSVVYDTANNRMIVFGSVGAASGVPNRVWVLTNANGLGGTPEWTELMPTGGPPAPRAQQMAVYDQANNRLIVYGGYTTGYAGLSDLWVLTNANGLDGTPQWISLSYSGGPPSKRIQSIPTYDAANNRMMIFGGCKNPSVPCFMLNDVWVLSNANGVGGTPQFTQLYPAGGSPAPRGAYGIGYDGVSNRLMVFGGGGNYPVNHLNDTWVLTNANGLGGAPSWIQLSTATIPPGPYGMSSAYDSTTNELFVVGGVTAAGGGDKRCLEAGQRQRIGHPGMGATVS